MPKTYQLLFLITFLFNACAAAAPPAIDFQRDVVYGKTAGQELKLDLARPAGPTDKTLACILFVHGGAWAHGDKSGLEGAIRTTAANGYVAVAVNYRLVPDAIFPAQIQDVKCAVRFLRSHAAQFGIDPARIGAIGDSAGGHLVLMLAVTTAKDSLEGDGGWQDTSSDVGAVVSWYGPTDLNAADMPVTSKPLIQAFLTPASYPPADLIARASPIHYVHADEPPILLLQGTSDPIVPFTQAVVMAKRMTEVHAPGRAELILNASHGFAGEDHQHVLSATLAFFKEHLKPAPSK